MADIFREVDEDIRQERYLKLWRRWRYWLLGVAVVALGAAVAYVVIDDARESARQAEGRQFAAALDALDAGRASEAADRFAALAAESGTGYAALARIAEADARARRGDVTGAVDAYDRMARDDRVPALYRDLAALLAAQRSLDRAPVAEIDQRLAPLVIGASPWRPLAAELSGIAALRAGDEGTARAVFAALAGDQAAPLGQRRRAAELLASLGGSLEDVRAGADPFAAGGETTGGETTDGEAAQ